MMWKCRHYKVCELFREESVVCNSGGGSYCGRWRYFEELLMKRKKLRRKKMKKKIKEFFSFSNINNEKIKEFFSFSGVNKETKKMFGSLWKNLIIWGSILLWVLLFWMIIGTLIHSSDTGTIIFTFSIVELWFLFVFILFVLINAMLLLYKELRDFFRKKK